jgi:transaldolase
MQLLLDSANLEEARQAADWGWVSGATTNPILLAQAGLPPAKALKKLGKLFSGPIFYQLTGASLDDMKAEAGMARDILGDQLVLKIPATPLGFQAATRLSKKYSVAITSLFTVAQALTANAAGARYALYYHNRAKRLLKDGATLPARLVQALVRTETLVVAASLKTADELVEARSSGVPILSAKFDVLAQLPVNEHSDAALADFDRNGTGLLNPFPKERA